jgi:hypothetical protein
MSGKLLLILIGTIAFFLGLYILMANVMDDTLTENARTPEEQMEEIEAEKRFFPKLDELYEAGDYEGLVKLAKSPESDKIDIWNYSHYDLLNFYSQYVSIRDEYIPQLDEGKITKDGARWLTEVTFSFYYRCYDNTMGVSGNASKSDLEVLDHIRDDFILDILYNRMGYTKEDMDAARGEIMESNYFHTAQADKFSDRYCERYK